MLQAHFWKKGPSRIRFVLLAVFLFWIKTILAYHLEFSLGVDGPYQYFLLLLNPIATAVLLFSLPLYVSDRKKSFRFLFVIYFLAGSLLYANMLYYREFSDFLTLNTILGSKAVTESLSTGIFAMLEFRDILYWIDLAFLIWLYRRDGSKSPERIPAKRKWMAAGMTAASLGLFFVNLTLAEIDRPQLLTRTFDRNYIVKYLGLNVYTVYDAVQTMEAQTVRAQASSSDMAQVLPYVEEHYAAPSEAAFGQAEGRNVVFIHLESMQQFLIGMQMQQENGEVSEVTPFLNSLYNSPDSYSFSNFFHQTGQGKTSDAELLIDNSLFGLPQGSAFTQFGYSNTFHSGPAILKSEGYTSAVFHGNVGSFWDRNNTYRSMGYDYFFSADNAYTLTEENSVEYGMKDKLFFRESVQYLEQLPQPYYAKFITVSNHFPYPPNQEELLFNIPDTTDETINGYFDTVHYADAALAEFFQYMKDSGMYDNTMFVLYGDHFGISNSRNATLAPLLGKDPSTWSAYDNAMLQRVPLIIHIPGIGTGGVNDTFGGQVDVLPTVLHLLGVDTQTHVQLGQDLLAPERTEIVAFRNGSVVTPDYTVLGNNVYETSTGAPLLLSAEETEDEEQAETQAFEMQQLQEKIADIQEKAATQLSLSDRILNEDLLRFYTPVGFAQVDKNSFNYQDDASELIQERLARNNAGTSLLEQNNGESTVKLYQTDAPELLTAEEEEEDIQPREGAAEEGNLLNNILPGLFTENEGRQVVPEDSPETEPVEQPVDDTVTE